MSSISKKYPNFKKNTLEIATPLANLPFMFSVGVPSDRYVPTSASDRKESIPSPKSQKHKSSFTQELQKLGISAKSIPEKNPLKMTPLRNESPDIGIQTGLPFQRRARSSSPHRDSLKIQEKKHSNMFSPRSPVVLSHKLKFKEDFTGLCRDSGFNEVEEDEDLKILKEEYRKLLEGAVSNKHDDDSDDVEDEGEIDKIETEFGFKNPRRYF